MAIPFTKPDCFTAFQTLRICFMDMDADIDVHMDTETDIGIDISRIDIEIVISIAGAHCLVTQKL